MSNHPPYAICFLSQVPVRETVSHSSEMITELLFGDTVEIKEKYQHWYKIVNLYDNYEGWVDSKQLMPIGNEEFLLHKNDKDRFVTADTLNVVERNSDHAIFTVGMGCSLPLFDQKHFKLGNQTYSFTGTWKDTSIYIEGKEKRKSLVSLAEKMLNTPYLWGGRSVFANDCSGLVQLIYKVSGIRLLRDASQQAEQGNPIHCIEEAQAGDLMFFDNENEKIVHVGIYNGNGHIIHNSGMVRRDHVDKEGIIRCETGKYTHHLCRIRSFID